MLLHESGATRLLQIESSFPRRPSASSVYGRRSVLPTFFRLAQTLPCHRRISTGSRGTGCRLRDMRSVDRGESLRSSGHSRRAELGTGDLPPFFEEPVHRGTDSGIRIVVGLFWAAVARHRAGSSATVFFACAPSWLPSGLRLSSQRGGFWWRTISGERRVESFPLQLLAGSALCQTLPFLSPPS